MRRRIGAFARELFGSSDAAVGQTFEISGIPFTIVGVFKKSVDDFGQSEIADQTILIPFSVARYFTGTDNVKQIYFSMSSMDEVPDAAKEIVRIVQARHRPNSIYKAQNLKELLDHGGQDRQRADGCADAGGRRHAGRGRRGHHEHHAGQCARPHPRDRHPQGAGRNLPRDQVQFLAEAVIISLVGGLVGTFVGLAPPLAVRLFTDYSVPISPWSVVIALTVATLVGVIFGTVPATRAAQMDPVESLKYE